MKVCTDACLFGARVSQKIRNQKSEIRNLLDIGTGTGLLALMYAQRNPDAIIDAVEIDEAAAKQAKENFDASPWEARLNVYHDPIQQFNASAKYDLIISNPPFFENDLKSKNAKRNVALHSSDLSLEELSDAVVKHLQEEGIFAILLPYHRTEEFIDLAMKRSLHLSKKILVKQTPSRNYFRSMAWFTKKIIQVEESEIIIQNEDGKYSNEFIELLGDYYLYL